MDVGRRVLLFLSLSAMTSGLFAQGFFGNGVSETIEQEVPLDPGGDFSITNVNGAISVESWNQPMVRIVATKKAKNQEQLDRLEVSIDGAGGAVRVETRYDGSTRNVKGGVSYRITVPAEVELRVETVNGSLNVEKVQGRVEAHSVNGSVKVLDLAGSALVKTTNGSIEVRYVTAANDSHEFTSTNGSVRLYLPSDAGGQLNAQTSNGRVSVDFPTSGGSTNRRRFEGSFGSGSGDYRIKTVNGSVKIAEN